jgi:hypothetical protein
VCVEGTRTEDLYLTHWKRIHRATISVDVDTTKTAPLSVVRHAIELKDRERSRGSRRRHEAHDEIWCMFDVDEHPNLDEALSLARAHDIRVALSNPCVELWFLLHFKEQSAFIDRHEVQRACERLLGCGKVLSSAALYDLHGRHDEAVARAQALTKRHEAAGSRSDENPSSNVWELIDRIRDS